MHVAMRLQDEILWDISRQTNVSGVHASQEPLSGVHASHEPLL